ncbi:MAG: hypothetical protein ACRDO8_02890 [Nocardioidaceae bacterium]
MKRPATAACCVVLSIGMLSACGGGNDEYCSEIKQTKKTIGGIDGSQATSADFKKATDSIDKIADEAPESVKDDWRRIGKALGRVLKAVEDAGLKVEDLRDPSTAQDVDPQKLKKIQAAAQDMTKVTKSQEKVSKEVKKDCDIDLGSGS